MQCNVEVEFFFHSRIVACVYMDFQLQHDASKNCEPTHGDCNWFVGFLFTSCAVRKVADCVICNGVQANAFQLALQQNIQFFSNMCPQSNEEYKKVSNS